MPGNYCARYERRATARFAWPVLIHINLLLEVVEVVKEAVRRARPRVAVYSTNLRTSPAIPQRPNVERHGVGAVGHPSPTTFARDIRQLAALAGKHNRGCRRSQDGAPGAETQP
jgi:hypothetical protein